MAAHSYSPGERVTAHIPGDAILEPYTGPATVIEHIGGLVRLQMEGLVPAHHVRDPETGATGPGWLDRPMVELEPQHVTVSRSRPHPRQRQLEPTSIVVHGYDAVGTLRQRSSIAIPPDQHDLAWFQAELDNNKVLKIVFEPPIALLRMPLEYAVWEPIL